MTISPLAQMPQAIPLLASWMHNEWQTFDDRSVAMIERQLTENLHPDRIPITFIAHRDGDLLGTISLDISDLDGFDHLSPWLASFTSCPRLGWRVSEVPSFVTFNSSLRYTVSRRCTFGHWRRPILRDVWLDRA